ncbi:MAG: ABC transporter substrate-binding protein [Conexivisphaerales archaeon]
MGYKSGMMGLRRTKRRLAASTALVVIIIIVIAAVVGVGAYYVGSMSKAPTTQSYGSIQGTVVNSSGQPVAGAIVSVAGHTATTDASGHFLIANVTAGTYTLTITATGYASSSQTITVSSGQSVSITPSLAAAPSSKYYTLSVIRNAASNDMDPRETSTTDVVQNVYDQLTHVDPNLTVVPDLATSWTHNSNYTQWTFQLRQGVTFHDGTPFNSTAVVFSIQDTVKLGEGDAPDVWAGLQSVTATGPYTVVITWDYPANVPLIVGSGYAAFIFSPNIWNYAGITPGNDTALHNWFTQFHDDGSGPYVIVTNQSNAQTGITLQAYPNYWGGWTSGQFNKVVIKFVQSTPTAVQLLMSGQVNQTGLNGQFQYVPQLLAAGDQVIPANSFAAIWLLFNTQHPLLNNSVVRQALLTALNYQQILATAYYGYGSLFPGGINPGKPFYNPSSPGYPATGNLTLAKQMLASIGITGGLNVTWTVTYSTGSPFLGTAAQVMQTDWKPLGVTLNIQGMSFGQLAQKAGYYNQTTGQLFSPGPISYAKNSSAQDILLLNWVGAVNDPWLVMNELFAIQPPPYQNDILFNWAYWQNTTFTNLLNQAHYNEAANPALAQEQYNTLNAMLYQAAPGWPLFAEQTVYAFGPHVGGFIPNPNYGFSYPFFYQLYYKP